MQIGDYICSSSYSALAEFIHEPAWRLTEAAPAIVQKIMASCGPDYKMLGDAAVHRSVTIEAGAMIKGPAVIGPGCFIASNALVRGGCWMERDCTLGPAVELKTSFMFSGAKVAHLSFVGDSMLGSDVNIEAGAMIANYRNERTDKRIRIITVDGVIDTGVEKFGALVGDGARLGANAVIAPGALLAPGSIVPRLALVDQAPA
jgi:NDP-sugar pyrophosphorylase family protein